MHQAKHSSIQFKKYGMKEALPLKPELQVLKPLGITSSETVYSHIVISFYLLLLFICKHRCDVLLAVLYR